MVRNIPADKNIIITGFMGTGKTTVGHLLAERIGRSFVDLDQQLEAHFGKSIPQIFSEDGEPAFRAAESRLCHHFAAITGNVLSTGGGALVNQENLRVLADSGVIVCLTATVDTILERVDKVRERPLLQGNTQERRVRIRELLKLRRPAYALIPLHVDTTGLSPSQIVEHVLDTLDANAEVPGMNRIAVHNPEGEYHICVGSTLLTRVGHLMARRALQPGPVAIVTNEDVGKHYAAVVAEGLEHGWLSPDHLSRAGR